MNLQQLEYILAIDSTRQFVAAARKCHVTQATLSMMVRKLEDELGVRIFDRSRSPVVTTAAGLKVLESARAILRERDRMLEIIAEEGQEPKGDLRMGIIPTLAPYLLPLFLTRFLRDHPKINLQVHELTTEEILQRLRQNDLDAGLLAIPLEDSAFLEHHLFFEEFVVYAPGSERLMKKKYVLAGDIDINRLWLLQEGHCLREQVINLCELKSREKAMHQLDFAAGSIETLRRMVEINQGITILPSLALRHMTKDQLRHVRHFRAPAPVRQIGLVTYRHALKENLLGALRQSILDHLPAEYKHPAHKVRVQSIQPA